MATRSSSRSISGCRTDNQWLDVADTNKYKPRYMCQFCKKEFSVSNALARHMKYNCLQNPGSKCNTSVTHPFVCNVCGRRFTVRKSLTYHEKHECQEFVTCPICNKRLVGANVPKRHIENCKRKERLVRREKLTAVVLPVKNCHSQLILSSSDDNSD